jgi:hypothetical protein
MLREEDVGDYAVYAEAVQLRRALLARQGLLTSVGGGTSIAAAAGLSDGMLPAAAAGAVRPRSRKRRKQDVPAAEQDGGDLTAEEEECET